MIWICWHSLAATSLTFFAPTKWVWHLWHLFLRVRLPAPSRSQAVVQPDEPTWRSLWANSPKRQPRRCRVSTRVSHEFSSKPNAGIKAKLPAPITTSPHSRIVMLNSALLKKKKDSVTAAHTSNQCLLQIYKFLGLWWTLGPNWVFQ